MGAILHKLELQSGAPPVPPMKPQGQPSLSRHVSGRASAGRAGEGVEHRPPAVAVAGIGFEPMTFRLMIVEPGVSLPCSYRRAVSALNCRFR